MRVLLAALVAVLPTVPSAWAQAAFVGVDDDPAIGAASAKVTIIEFGDYQCASCRQFWRDVEPNLKKDHIDTGR